MYTRLSKPWYLLLLPAFFVVHGFTENFPLVPGKDAVLLLLLYLFSAVVLGYLCWLYLRDLDRAAFISFLLLSFYFFFGYIHDILQDILPNSMGTSYRVVLLVLTLIFVLVLRFLKKRRPNISRLQVYLNVLLVIFILFDFITLTTSFFKKDQSGPAAIQYLPCNKSSLPDVYLILSDEYAGQKQLMDLYGYDNSPFYDSLESRGFYVVRNSRSNYNFTLYSLASIFDMDYLKLSREELREADPVVAYKRIFYNNLIPYFKTLGYQFYNHSFFDFNESFTNTANSFVPGRTILFTSQTLFSRFEKEVWLPMATRFDLDWALKHKKYEDLRYNSEVMEATLQNVREKSASPRFIYAHFELPHYPYYFDSSGVQHSYEVLKNDRITNSDHYVQYLRYGNNQLKQLIDSILKNSSRPPVIVLMSDHGYRKYDPGRSPAYRYMNLLSVYLPARDYSKFSDTMTNVNVFRSILNAEFCQQLPLLKDTCVSVEFEIE